MFSYVINGITYIQKPLVLGQIRQITSVIKKIAEGGGLPTGGTPFEWIEILGDKLPLALAVVLTPEGGDPRSKDLAALGDELEFNILPDQVIQVVTDFFDCNPIHSLLAKLQGLTGSIKKVAQTMKTGLTSSSASSQEEISASEKQSSGKSHPKSASPT